jgi:hypothetical protein
MKQLNWQETVRIFTEAAKLSTEDQGFFIQTQCGDDFELHREVESLLEFDRKNPEFLEIDEILDVVKQIQNDYLSTRLFAKAKYIFV